MTQLATGPSPAMHLAVRAGVTHLHPRIGCGRIECSPAFAATAQSCFQHHEAGGVDSPHVAETRSREASGVVFDATTIGQGCGEVYAAKPSCATSQFLKRFRR